MDSNFTFDDYAAALQPYYQLESASFVQGMLVGFLSSSPKSTEAQWIKSLVEEGGISKVKESFLVMLHQLYIDTLAGLNSETCELDLLLPDDDAPLAQRVNLLAQWCEGFMYGLGLGELGDISREVAEVLNDLADIALLDIPEQEDEQLNASLVELIEFVRMAAIMVFDEQNPVAKPKIEVTKEQALLAGLQSTPKPTLH
ncbi:YecA family protein [Thiomicrospira sp. R3]|uniref:YecA family protein n=1 Tax=Thiomicrospira sp. R3 TaxID=3035472 RepID=UPI00259B35FF|nr:YecA family protein [Thiomicrospira sp. R3]WFE68762.1 YecA family protein [Thiomicrospira sp. R3]